MKLLYLILVCASALKPKEQPSGFFNFSRINNITLPSKSSIDSKLYVYAIVPNILRITTGMIAFPNDLYYDSPYPKSHSNPLSEHRRRPSQHDAGLDNVNQVEGSKSSDPENTILQDKYLTSNPKITFNKINSGFGKTFTFSPLNDNCKTDFEKETAKLCLKYHPNDWWCIYESCISLSRTIPHYIKIVLPPIYHNNETTKQCFLFT
jgi:hypothetical protein